MRSTYREQRGQHQVESKAVEPGEPEDSGARPSEHRARRPAAAPAESDNESASNGPGGLEKHGEQHGKNRAGARSVAGAHVPLQSRFLPAADALTSKTRGRTKEGRREVRARGRCVWGRGMPQLRCTSWCLEQSAWAGCGAGARSGRRGQEGRAVGRKVEGRGRKGSKDGKRGEFRKEGKKERWKERG